MAIVSKQFINDLKTHTFKLSIQCLQLNIYLNEACLLNFYFLLKKLNTGKSPKQIS